MTESVEPVETCPKPQFTCNICASTFNSKKLLYLHKLRTHADSVPCETCSKLFRSKKHLKTHIKLVHEAPEHKCPLCHKPFSRPWNLKIHVKLCGKVTPNCGEVACHVCSKMFAHEESLSIHMKKFHTITCSDGSFMVQSQQSNRWTHKRPEIVCKVCRKSFKSSQILKKHMRIVHEAIEDEKTITVNRSRGNVERFVMMKSSVQNLSCTVQSCGQEFVSIDSLNRHLKSNHKGEYVFMCKVCDAGFNSSINLSHHKFKVHTVRNFACKKCTSTFKLKQSLKRHENSHTNPKPVKLRKPNETVSRRELKRRENETVYEISSKVKSYNTKSQKSILLSIIKLNPDILDKFSDNPISLDDVREMVIDNSLPDLVMFNILKKLRQKWGMKICERNIRKNLIKKKKVFAPYFSNVFLNHDADLGPVSEECFCDKDGNPLARHYTYCSDLPGLVTAIKSHVPKLDSDEYFVVLGMDGGKKNLKICMNYSKKAKDEGKWKLMGPKHSIVLATVVDVPETYHNMSLMLKSIQAELLNFKLSTDLKLVNILVGKQSAGCKHPCPYCESHKGADGRWVPGNLTTFSDLKHNYNSYKNHGKGQRKNLMNYKNQEFEPLLYSPDYVLYVIPPQVLHGVLFLTNKIIEDVVKVKNEMVHIMGEQCDIELINWNIHAVIKQLFIVREAYQGKTYEGKQCRLILKSIDNLGIPDELKPFETAFKALKSLVSMCYAEVLPTNYCSVINEFKRAYEVLIVRFRVSITNKLHIVFDHLCNYYDQTRLSLRKTSDELIENMHQYVHKRMVKGGYLVKDLLNPRHGVNLYRAVLHINAYNVIFHNGDKDVETYLLFIFKTE